MKDANRTACAIANKIKQSGYIPINEKISQEAYKWLEHNANSLATLVEELLDSKFEVYIIGDIEEGEYYIHVEWNRVK